jgi:dihydrofolate reductase
MIVSAIAAVSRNGVIGRKGRLPWHYPEDLARFKTLTTGHAVLMGRRTFESIGRPLPGRRNVVLTRAPAPRLPEGVLSFNSLEAALQACAESGETELFVIGGAELYAQALPLCDRLYLTRIERDVEGDAHFPPWDPAEWVERERKAKGELVFSVYERKR